MHSRPSRDVLEADYREGPLVEVARKHCVSPQTVWRWLRALKITVRPKSAKCVWRRAKPPGLYRDRVWLSDQYESHQKSISRIANESGASPRTIWRWLHAHGIRVRTTSEAGMVGVRNTGRYPAGPAHPAWRGGRFVNTQGYVCVRVGKRYVLEHRAIVENRIGRPLTKDEIVHHINGIKTDNRSENLRVLSPAEHNPVLHLKEQIEALRAENARLKRRST